MMPLYEGSEGFAARLDERDPLAKHRARFSIPSRPDGEPVLYLNGNSLGLMPKTARELVLQELDDWAALAVEAHFKGKTPWYSYHEVFRETGARLVGAIPGEVVMMNGLTVNLHLMMATFYRPTPSRHKILIEDGAFPSDTYAAQSQLTLHGFDPAESLIRVAPREGERHLRTEDLVELLRAHGGEIALVLLPGVQYYTGQLLDIAAITAAARAAGCVAGWDLAHAAGNVPLQLHDWDVDFAAWCSYKYLNSGPGGVAGCFVHERHGSGDGLPRMAGWWGNDPQTRFRMDTEREFVPRAGADGWQLSNPPILAMAPLRASLQIFEEAGMESLRRKSVVLTGYLEWLLDRTAGNRLEVITPRDPEARGCQLSLRVLDRPEEARSALEAAGVVLDFRPPDVLRVAPVPLYNTFREVWRFAQILGDADLAG
jgi:kynureninase